MAHRHFLQNRMECGLLGVLIKVGWPLVVNCVSWILRVFTVYCTIFFYFWMLWNFNNKWHFTGVYIVSLWVTIEMFLCLARYSGNMYVILTLRKQRQESWVLLPYQATEKGPRNPFSILPQMKKQRKKILLNFHINVHNFHINFHLNVAHIIAI